MARYNRRWMVGARKADSKWEGRLRDTVLKDLEYHPDKVSYVVSRTYQPDFKLVKKVNNIDKVIFIETKGRFRESSEASKYKFIRDSLRGEGELVFIFYNPKTPMPHAKKRKDGTKQTHSEWAERNGFRWFTEDTIGEIL